MQSYTASKTNVREHFDLVDIILVWLTKTIIIKLLGKLILKYCQTENRVSKQIVCFPIDSQDVNYGNTLEIQEPVSKVYKIYDNVNYYFMADNNNSAL